MTVLYTANGSLVGEGGYAHVFAHADDTVIKLFRRHRIVEGDIDDDRDHEIVLRAVWDAECSAYELLLQHPAHARFTPRFYGRIEVSDVIGASGESLAAEYLLDCSYRMQRVPGSDVKIGHLVGSPIFSALDAYLDELEAIGIGYSHDGSAFVPGVGTPFTVIDFATWDAMADLSMALVTNGRLSDTARKRWARRAAT